jgi:hypothetical protein
VGALPPITMIENEVNHMDEFMVFVKEFDALAMFNIIIGFTVYGITSLFFELFMMVQKKWKNRKTSVEKKKDKNIVD